MATRVEEVRAAIKDEFCLAAEQDGAKVREPEWEPVMPGEHTAPFCMTCEVRAERVLAAVGALWSEDEAERLRQTLNACEPPLDAPDCAWGRWRDALTASEIVDALRAYAAPQTEGPK